MQRYAVRPDIVRISSDIMIAVPHGDYVLYSEVKAIEEERDRLKAENERLKANIVMHRKEHERRRNETDQERIAELEANNKFLMDYRDRLIERVKELEEERDGFRNGQEQAQFLLNGVMDANANLAAYNRKLLDENLALLNERNEARRKAEELEEARNKTQQVLEVKP